MIGAAESPAAADPLPARAVSSPPVEPKPVGVDARAVVAPAEVAEEKVRTVDPDVVVRDPLVQQAIELFGARVVDIQPRRV